MGNVIWLDVLELSVPFNGEACRWPISSGISVMSLFFYLEPHEVLDFTMDHISVFMLKMVCIVL
jgi:hypothetical protein